MLACGQHSYPFSRQRVCKQYTISSSFSFILNHVFFHSVSINWWKWTIPQAIRQAIHQAIPQTNGNFYARIMNSSLCITPCCHRIVDFVDLFSYVSCFHSLSSVNIFYWILGLEMKNRANIYMYNFSYSCKMRYLLNLVLENWEYLWFY